MRLVTAALVPGFHDRCLDTEIGHAGGVEDGEIGFACGVGGGERRG
jgi:hypothetical protein